MQGHSARTHRLTLAACLLLGGACEPLYEPGRSRPVPDLADSGQREPEVRAVPNMMLVIDRSGSMALPITCPEEPCPSRLAVLAGALGTFLTENATRAQYGLLEYGTGVGMGCDAPTLADLTSVGVPAQALLRAVE